MMRAAMVSLQQGANDDLFGLWFGSPHELVLVRPRAPVQAPVLDDDGCTSTPPSVFALLPLALLGRRRRSGRTTAQRG